jgi:serine/threonine protein kinase
MTDDLREDGEPIDSDAHSDYAGALTSIPEVAEINALLPDYQVQAVIGQGGMGAVYKAWQSRLERFVAIKVLPAEAGGELDFAESFRTEARTMANLKHSNIAAVYDFGEAGGYLYLVMEYVDGSTLFDLIHANALSVDQIMNVVHQVCDALTYAHSQNVIHRDIKSANILIGSDSKAKVVDFGLATLQAAPQLWKRQVNDGPIMGTIGCSAPEILKPGSVVDQRADVYSLGVVLYEALTKRTMETPWVSPARAAGTPPQLDGVILKATKVDPTERYQSVEQFEAGLKQLAKFSSSATAKRSPTGVAAAVRPVMPQKSAGSPMPMIAGVAAIASVAGLFFFLSGKKKNEVVPRPGAVAVELVVPSGVKPENVKREPVPVAKVEISAPEPESKKTEIPPLPEPEIPVGMPKVKIEKKPAGVLASEKLLEALEEDAAKIYGADVGDLLGI